MEESYFCGADCETCGSPDEEKAICMQARIISDLCTEQGIPLENGFERHAQAFREELWDKGIHDHYELATVLRRANRGVYRIISAPFGSSPAGFFPAQVLEAL